MDKLIGENKNLHIWLLCLRDFGVSTDSSVRVADSGGLNALPGPAYRLKSNHEYLNIKRMAGVLNALTGPAYRLK